MFGLFKVDTTKIDMARWCLACCRWTLQRQTRHGGVWLVEDEQCKDRQGMVVFGLLKVDNTKTDKAWWCLAC